MRIGNRAPGTPLSEVIGELERQRAELQGALLAIVAIDDCHDYYHDACHCLKEAQRIAQEGLDG